MSMEKTLQKVGDEYQKEYDEAMEKNMRVLNNSFLPRISSKDKKFLAMDLATNNLVLNNTILEPKFRDLQKLFGDD